MLSMKYNKGESLAAAIFRTSEMLSEAKENSEKAMELLKTIGLESKRDKFTSNSHGQRRLLEIARTLGTDSEFYLFE